jgi:hypothetical protein
VNFGAGSAANLTLASNTKINHKGNLAEITDNNTSFGGGTVTEQGVINAVWLNGTFQVIANSFVNKGTVAIANNDDLIIATNSFVNTGTVTITTGGTLDIGTSNSNATNTFDNTGVLSENGGTLNMNGTVAFGNYAQIQRTGGVVAMNGFSDLGGHTLSVGTGSALGALTVGGTMQNGTIHDADPGLIMNGGVLQNLTDLGTLDMRSSGANGTLAGTITLAGLSGTGAFTMLLEGAGALLTITSANLANANLAIGAAGANATLLGAATNAAGGSIPVVLASNFGITHAAGGATLTGRFVDNGVINAAVNGGTFSINGSAFTNNNTINVTNFDLLNIFTSVWVNNGLLNIDTGGIVNLGQAFAFGGGMTWGGSGSITLKAGTLNIFGTPTLGNLNTITHVKALGGLLNFFGVTNLGTSTLTVGGASKLGLVLDGGTFNGGTISDGGNGMEFIAAATEAALGGLLGGTAKLNNVTYQGFLDLSETGAILTVSNLKVTGAGGGRQRGDRADRRGVGAQLRGHADDRQYDDRHRQRERGRRDAGADRYDGARRGADAGDRRAYFADRVARAHHRGANVRERDREQGHDLRQPDRQRNVYLRRHVRQ